MKHIYLLSLIIASLLFSCDDEDNLYVELEKGKYYIDENPKGEVQKYIYDFYKKYNSIILTNPDTSDYRYNFTSINRILIEPPVKKNIYKEELTDEENQLLMKGFDFIKEVFFDLYNDEFKKDFFPTTIQLGNIIKKWEENSTDTIKIPAYSSYNFIAISGINKNLSTMSAKEKMAYKAKINTEFWYSYLVMGVNKLNIPNSFYEVSKEYYNSEEIDSDWEGDWEKSYNNGFVIGTYWGYYPLEKQDIISYFEFIFKTNKNDLDNMLSKYPKIKLKYEILRNTILKEFNFDIHEINK